MPTQRIDPKVIFVRTDESILAMQSVLNLTDERVDEMWRYAMTL